MKKKKKSRRSDRATQGAPATLAKRLVRTSDPEPGLTYTLVGAQLAEVEPTYIRIDDETHRRLVARKRPVPRR